MKKIIINADDFGLCDSVSKGIIDCYTKGLVSDFSFIVNPDSINKSIELLAKHKIYNCGIHFNLTLGRTAFQPRKNVSDKNGNFYPVKKHLISFLYGHLSVEDIYEEFKL
jgi:chitin disaccharide deacetylase